MRFHRVHYSNEGGNCGGFTWHTTKVEAQKVAREARQNDPEEYIDTPMDDMVEEIDVPTTKKELLSFLNIMVAYPDNG